MIVMGLGGVDSLENRILAGVRYADPIRVRQDSVVLFWGTDLGERVVRGGHPRN